MLHYQTVDSPTLELLKALQAIDAFKNLRLVVGTSLSLQYGHRKSVQQMHWDIQKNYYIGLFAIHEKYIAIKKQRILKV